MNETDDLRKLGDFFEKNVAFCVFLGLKVPHLAPGEVTCLLPFKPEFIGDPWRPALNGGVASFLADNCAGIAALSTVPFGSRCSTVDLRIDYLAPAGPFDMLAQAKVLKAGRQLVTSEVTITQSNAGQETVIAKAIGVFSMKPQFAAQGGLTVPSPA
jgi:uncharacterized protein (TIGR00369 family)